MRTVLQIRRYKNEICSLILTVIAEAFTRTAFLEVFIFFQLPQTSIDDNDKLYKVDFSILC